MKTKSVSYINYRNTFWLELKFLIMLHGVGLSEIMMRMMMISDNDEENGSLNDSKIQGF